MHHKTKMSLFDFLLKGSNGLSELCIKLDLKFHWYEIILTNSVENSIGIKLFCQTERKIPFVWNVSVKLDGKFCMTLFYQSEWKTPFVRNCSVNLDGKFCLYDIVLSIRMKNSICMKLFCQSGWKIVMVWNCSVKLNGKFCWYDIVLSNWRKTPLI